MNICWLTGAPQFDLSHSLIEAKILIFVVALYSLTKVHGNFQLGTKPEEGHGCIHVGKYFMRYDYLHLCTKCRL